MMREIMSFRSDDVVSVVVFASRFSVVVVFELITFSPLFAVLAVD